MKNFKEKIKEVLIRKNVSIKELAQKLNVTSSAVSQIIAGENPQLNWLHKVSKILNVDITELIPDITPNPKIRGIVEIDDKIYTIKSKNDLLEIISKLNPEIDW